MKPHLNVNVYRHNPSPVSEPTLSGIFWPVPIRPEVYATATRCLPFSTLRQERELGMGKNVNCCIVSGTKRENAARPDCVARLLLVGVWLYSTKEEDSR
ncbi:unnamed protein product [Protopolystoma xenopodis]|uniref:Uncharacterized protein n=1 Tax=Protopolystoma xenopodis TaxID=117903 RepID=A0A3S5A1C7_9PLAT|nr:unnamed protein product [Protopolystoma xenopodis]